MWLVIVSNAIPIHYPALMVLKIHKSDNIITLATETWNQQSILLLFGMFMTYSTSYCHSDKLMDPRNVCMLQCMYICYNVGTYVALYVHMLQCMYICYTVCMLQCMHVCYSVCTYVTVYVRVLQCMYVCCSVCTYVAV